MNVAFDAERNWALPAGERREIVPGASHFAALSIASPNWRNAYQVATIGDHTFYKVQNLAAAVVTIRAGGSVARPPPGSGIVGVSRPHHLEFP